MTCTLRNPLEGLTFFQRMIWPLIFAQLWALKLRVRRRYGRGVPYRYWISPLGRVCLLFTAADRVRGDVAAGPLTLAPFAFTCGCAQGAAETACALPLAPRPPAPASAVSEGAAAGPSGAPLHNTS